MKIYFLMNMGIFLAMLVLPDLTVCIYVYFNFCQLEYSIYIYNIYNMHLFLHVYDDNISIYIYRFTSIYIDGNGSTGCEQHNGFSRSILLTFFANL